MLSLSREQVSAFNDRLFDSFVDEMCARARMRGSVYVAEMTADALRTLVAHEVRRARGAGLVVRGHARRWLDSVFTFGPSLADEGWVAETLADPRLVPAARLHRIERRLVFRVADR